MLGAPLIWAYHYWLTGPHAWYDWLGVGGPLPRAWTPVVVIPISGSPAHWFGAANRALGDSVAAALKSKGVEVVPDRTP